jgi:anti-anti-sigma regulatory factor
LKKFERSAFLSPSLIVAVELSVLVVVEQLLLVVFINLTKIWHQAQKNKHLLLSCFPEKINEIINDCSLKWFFFFKDYLLISRNLYQPDCFAEISL